MLAVAVASLPSTHATTDAAASAAAGAAACGK
jgi:hypothetical protein